MIHYALNVRQKMAVGTAIFVATCWLVYFVFAPTIGFNLLGSWHNEQRALQVALLLCTTLSYLWLSLECNAIPVVRIAAPLWIAFGLGTISTCLAALPYHAAAEVALHVQLVLLGAFFATLARITPLRSSMGILYSAWLIGAVYVIGVAANYVGVIVEKRPVDMEVFVLGYANQRFASALHALILPLIAWLALDRSAKLSLRYSSWAIAVLLWTINLAMGTRAIWAAFFAAGIVFWCLGVSGGRRAIKAVSATATIGVLVYLLIWLFVPSVLPHGGSMHSRVGDLESGTGRFELWKVAATESFDHPWFGIGPMHFATLRIWYGAHPHSWPLQLAAEWGLPALIAILFAIFVWGRCVRSALADRMHTSNEDALPAFGLSVTAAIFYGLLDGNWVMPVSQSLVAILIGASLGLLADPVPSQLRRSLGFRGIVVICVALASSLVLAHYTTHTLGEQLQGEKDYHEKFHEQVFLPRFWQQGLIFDQTPE